MKFQLLANTLSHLKFRQMAYQLYYRLYKPKFKLYLYHNDVNSKNLEECISKYDSMKNESTFHFLNIKSSFISWNFTGNGMLWAYNLNYMDWLCQNNLPFKIGVIWIEKFIDDITTNKVGLDPYPIALRGINWIKFIIKDYGSVEPDRLKRWNDFLYSQYKLLEKKLEWHLLGNHLLEDAYSLYMASIYFNDKKMYISYSKLLEKQLNEQILLDGAHYEQSPMYHCILLDRLLDCCNMSFNNILFTRQKEFNSFLKEKASVMLGHLESIIYRNGDIPLLNDSVYGIAPSSSELFDYAKRLGIQWKKLTLQECGYRKWDVGKFEVIIDVGDVKATYQPGHTHADTFNYELRINGNPFIIDTGISTYNKTERRQYERSSMAHNTVVVNNMDSSEVWGGFRVGKRAKVKVLEISRRFIKAFHRGFGYSHLHTRVFNLSNYDEFVIEDSVNGICDSISYIHLAPNVQILSNSKTKICTNLGTITIKNADSVVVSDETISFEYNSFKSIKVIKIKFLDKLTYKIIPINENIIPN